MNPAVNALQKATAEVCHSAFLPGVFMRRERKGE